MKKRLYIRCNPFFSLPQFPEECGLVRNTMVLRNILLCNPNDKKHLERGGIPDPFIEGDENGNPLYKRCEEDSRRAFEREKDDYDEGFLIFRTNYVQLNGTREQIIVGFYYIEDFLESKHGPIIVASKSKSKFISTKDALEISRRLKVNEYIKKHNLYRTSFYKGPHEKKLVEWLNAINSEELENRISEYQKEASRLTRLFEKHALTGENYPFCASCRLSAKTICPLEKRKKNTSIGNSYRISGQCRKPCGCQNT